MMINLNKILRKPYLTPLILFEDIEQDERDMLMAGSENTTGNDGTGGDGDNDVFGAKEGASFIFEEENEYDDIQ